MEENIRGKAFSGIIWGGMEKLSLQIFGFVQGIILARLLSPADYGLVAMVGIFVMLSYTFVDAGFGTALIQKKDRTEKDYSTVFLMNLSLSFFISLILFLSAPFIADFYKEQILTKIVRTYSFIIFLSSLVAIQDVRLSIFLEFKKKSIINMVITVVSGVLSIILAFSGYGVWSLIYPQFVMLFVKCLLYWHFQHWIPKLTFSRESFCKLFGFGSKILISSIMATFSGNIYSLVIGKIFSASALGFYGRADGYAALPVKTITGVVDSVTYPVLSKFQDNDAQLIGSFKRMLRISAYVIFPIMIGLVVLAKPLVLILVTEKVAAGVGYSYGNNEVTSFYTDREDLMQYDMATRVFGDSMEPELSDGDIILLKQGYDNVNGDIYVIDYDGKSYVKKLYNDGNRFVLKSINKKYSDIIIYTSDIQDTYFNIVGKVVDSFTPIEK